MPIRTAGPPPRCIPGASARRAYSTVIQRATEYYLLLLHSMCCAQRPNVDYDADEVDVHGGDASVDDLMHAFGI